MTKPSVQQPNQNILNLWALSKDQFDDWRKKNDIPRLLVFFKSNLPHFSNWLTESHISDQEFINYGTVSHFFIGNGPIYYSVISGDHGTGAITNSTVIVDLNKEQYRKRQIQLYKKEIYLIKTQKKMLPYFYWLKKRGLYLFKTPGCRNNSYTSDFQISSWQAPDTIFSKAFLFGKFDLLKLGGISIQASCLDGRNLDFVDLDRLILRGRGPTSTTSVAYSSCRSLHFENSEKSFVTFKRCHFENFSFKNCRIQDFHFVECAIRGMRIESSKINRSGFISTYPGGLEIDNTDLIDFYFSKPPKNIPFQSLSEFYRRLRSAYQQKAIRYQVSNSFFLERKYEMLGLFFPIVSINPKFPLRGYYNGYVDLYFRWRAGQYNNKKVCEILKREMVFVILMIVNPVYWWRLLTKKIKALSTLIDYLIWGFGERPSRVFFWMLLSISIFTARYYFSDIDKLSLNFFESLSCASFNFATMGCDKKVSSDAIQGIVGAILMGIMVAGFSNKSRY